MRVYDINVNENILEDLIEKALIDTVIWINNRCKPQEPDYVMALSTKFLKDFFNILVAVFPDYNFSVSGIYCHQKPLVDINLDKKPELGDILFVYVDKKLDGTRTLNSLLLQAKISNNAWLRVHKSDKHQLELYKKWPEFTYYRAGTLNGVKRNIVPKTINDGAQYLLIDNNPLTNGICMRKGMFPMGCSVPDDILCVNDSLSKELINFLKFKSGRSFDINPYLTEDDWSKMIWELLKIASFKRTRRRNARLEEVPRVSEYNHYYTEGMSEMTLLDEVFNDNMNVEDIYNENSGVSVVLIESELKWERE